MAVAVVAAAALAAVPAYALMDSRPDAGVTSYAPTRRTTVYRTEAVTTAETRFRKIPLMKLFVQARGAATIRFSGDFSGGPVEIEILRLPRRQLEPGVAHFTPAGDAESFSYDFVDTRRGGGIECRRYAVRWRSPTGAEVRLNHGSVTIDHRFDDTTRDGLKKTCVD